MDFFYFLHFISVKLREVELINQGLNFFINKALGPMIGSLISGLTAIYIFYKGSKKKQVEDLKHKQLEFKEREQYLKALSTQLIRQLRYQIELLDNCLSAIKNYNSKNLLLNVPHGLTTRNIRDIKTEDLFKIFVTYRKGIPLEKKVHNFADFNECLNVIDSFLKEKDRLNNDLDKKLEQYRTNFNLSMSEIMRAYNNFVRKANNVSKKTSDDPLLEELQNLLRVKQMELKKEGHLDNMDQMWTHIIQPLDHLFNNPDFAKDERVFLLIDSYIECSHIIIEYRNLRTAVEGSLKHHKKDLELIINVLEMCLNSVSNSKLLVVDNNQLKIADAIRENINTKEKKGKNFTHEIPV